ncbi:MAG: hypothetical protein P8Y68_19460, partial [Anaerolineales bacterium]
LLIVTGYAFVFCCIGSGEGVIEGTGGEGNEGFGACTSVIGVWVLVGIWLSLALFKLQLLAPAARATTPEIFRKSRRVMVLMTLWAGKFSLFNAGFDLFMLIGPHKMN